MLDPGEKGDTMFGIDFISTIELIWVFPLIMVIGAFLMAYYERVDIPILIFSVFISVIVALVFAPYQAIILQPTINALWYGYDWTVPYYLPILGLINLISIFGLGIMAVFNLWKTMGKSLWL